MMSEGRRRKRNGGRRRWQDDGDDRSGAGARGRREPRDENRKWRWDGAVDEAEEEADEDA